MCSTGLRTKPRRMIRSAPTKPCTARPVAGCISSIDRAASCSAKKRIAPVPTPLESVRPQAQLATMSNARRGKSNATHQKTAITRPFRLSVRAAQPPHREFDVAAGQLAPAFDAAHIGGLGIAGKEIAGFGPRLVARQREGLTQIAVVRLPPAGHPLGKIAGARDHVATPAHITTGPI